MCEIKPTLDERELIYMELMTPNLKGLLTVHENTVYMISNIYRRTSMELTIYVCAWFADDVNIIILGSGKLFFITAFMFSLTWHHCMLDET